MILYQFLMAFVLPFGVIDAAWRGGLRAVRQVLALEAALPAVSGPVLWLHTASVGEVTSVRWVLDAVLAARRDVQIVVTTNTTTARDLVQGWGIARVHPCLAPMDAAGAAGRFLDRWQPQALIIVENELWPGRIAAAGRRGVPVLVIGARVSERSARRWARVPGLIGAALAQIAWLSPQDSASAERLIGLGLPRAALGPVVTLKAQVRAPQTAQPPFAAPARRDATLLAASTHEGEDDAILGAFDDARKNGGPAFLILAPRHPERGDQIAALIAARGLACARRSRGEIPDARTPVFLADTLGEMAHWYAMAGICVIGGSFADRGGHTPFEPAAHGCALIHGQSLRNFAAPFAALDAGGGAIALQDLAELSEVLPRMDPDVQRAMAQKAAAALTPFLGSSQAIPERLLATLPRP